jgi:hypothetical protein
MFDPIAFLDSAPIGAQVIMGVVLGLAAACVTPRSMYFNRWWF